MHFGFGRNAARIFYSESFFLDGHTLGGVVFYLALIFVSFFSATRYDNPSAQYCKERAKANRIDTQINCS